MEATLTDPRNRVTAIRPYLDEWQRLQATLPEPRVPHTFHTISAPTRCDVLYGWASLSARVDAMRTSPANIDAYQRRERYVQALDRLTLYITGYTEHREPYNYRVGGAL